MLLDKAARAELSAQCVKQNPLQDRARSTSDLWNFAEQGGKTGQEVSQTARTLHARRSLLVPKHWQQTALAFGVTGKSWVAT